MARTYGYKLTDAQRAKNEEAAMISYRAEVERILDPVDGADAYRIAVQCVDVTSGVTGTFLIPQTARKLEDFVAVGPVFRDFYDLLIAIKAQGAYTKGGLSLMRAWVTPAQLEAITAAYAAK